MAVVYSGNFYVPVDASLPEKRIKDMLDAIDPLFIINCANRTIELDEVEVVDYLSLNQNLKIRTRVEVTNMSPLYGIFTSGSTGLPKLVVKSHSSLISFIDQYVNMFNFNEFDIQGNQIPFYFDASTKDLFTTLKTGCLTNIIEKGLFSQPGKLAQYLVDNNITSICWVPSALSMISMFNVFEKIRPETIRRVLFVGEPMPTKQLKIWKKGLPNARYINLYGSTENAGNSLFYEVNREFNDDERIPIGRPFPNVKVYLLDEDGNLIKSNDTQTSGEICVAGDILASGYYKSMKLTEEKFIQNPLNKNFYERIFKTGDVGRYNEDGDIVYLCRRDYQIKINGCRVELGDIECAAMSLAGIQSVCSLYDEKKKKIVLFYTSKEDVRDELVAHLKVKLPAYMLPSKYIYLEKMPLNANGKIHRTELNQMYYSGDSNNAKEK